MVPPWLLFLMAGLVLLWGGYRIKLGLRSKAAEERALQRRGLFGMSRRTHILYGIIYVLLGAGLVAIGLGWRPLAWSDSPPPAPPASPTGGVPVETR